MMSLSPTLVERSVSQLEAIHLLLCRWSQVSNTEISLWGLELPYCAAENEAGGQGCTQRGLASGSTHEELAHQGLSGFLYTAHAVRRRLRILMVPKELQACSNGPSILACLRF